MRYQASNTRRENDRPRENSWSSRVIRRLSLQLAGALLLLGLWMAAASSSLETASRLGQQIHTLLGQSWDVTAAFSHLGEQLQQGEDPLRSVEEWCVSVFLPQEITLEEGNDC